MVEPWLLDTRASYDADAEGYALQVEGLLSRQPHLSGSLAVFAQAVHHAGGGPVADVGCGPGYVTAHLRDLGVEAFGIDVSPEMVAVARRDHPGLRFEVGTMTALELATSSLAGLVAFWSVIHVPDDALPGVFAEFSRVLRPGAPLLVGFPVGEGVEHTSEGYTGRPVALDTHRRDPSRVEAWLRDAGFTIDARLVIRPHEDVPGAVIHARRGEAVV